MTREQASNRIMGAYVLLTGAVAWFFVIGVIVNW